MYKVSNNRVHTVSPQRLRWTMWIGYAACAWGIWFALEHLYWALGGTIGLVQNADTVSSSVQFAADPWSYILGWTLSVFLFSLLAFFPLALVWPFRWISQRRMQIALLITSYAAMLVLTLNSFALDFGLGLIPPIICAIGTVVAFVRPRSQKSIPHWMVLVATWALGIGMALYGSVYTITALLDPTSDHFLVYLFTGGMNWTIEGVLFVITAWLMSNKQTNLKANQDEISAINV